MNAVLDRLCEPIAILDVYASGLSHIEELGDGNLRFTFYTRQQSPHGGTENNIVARIILPSSAVHAATKMTMQQTGYACCGAARMKDRH